MTDETTRPDDPAGPTKTAPSGVMPTKEPGGTTGVTAFVENLAKWRDGTLILAGLAYVLGYLAWAIYAANHELGLAPVLDAQYFAAGVFPAAIVLAACFAIWWLRWLTLWIRKPVSRSGRTVQTVLEVAGGLCLLPGLLLWLFKRPAPVLAAYLLLTGFLAVIASSFFSREKTDIWYHRVLLGLAWINLPLVGTLVFLFYTTKIFPALPQAFGGPRPQRVALDVDVSKVSADTLRLLAPDQPENQPNPSGVLRSRHLNLVFQNSDYLFLQLDHESSPLRNQVFRLRSSAVESLFPVSEQNPRAPGESLPRR